MDVKDFQRLMVKYGVVIRAIPDKIISVFETSHVKEYPDGEIKYLENYKREMLIVSKSHKEAGKLVVVFSPNSSNSVSFNEHDTFESMEEIYKALKRKEEEENND